MPKTKITKKTSQKSKSDIKSILAFSAIAAVNALLSKVFDDKHQVLAAMTLPGAPKGILREIAEDPVFVPTKILEQSLEDKRIINS